MIAYDVTGATTSIAGRCRSYLLMGMQQSCLAKQQTRYNMKTLGRCQMILSIVVSRRIARLLE